MPDLEELRIPNCSTSRTSTLLLIGAQRTSSREAFMVRNFREKLNSELDLLCEPISKQ